MSTLDSIFPLLSENHIEAGKRSQLEYSDLHLLNAAGPGHMVVRATWRTKEGWQDSVARAFPLDASYEEIDAWKRANGWPGHNGSRWNYFKDAMRGYRKRKKREEEK